MVKIQYPESMIITISVICIVAGIIVFILWIRNKVIVKGDMKMKKTMVIKWKRNLVQENKQLISKSR